MANKKQTPAKKGQQPQRAEQRQPQQRQPQQRQVQARQQQAPKAGGKAAGGTRTRDRSGPLAFRDDLAAGYAPRLLSRYRNEIVPALMTELIISNVMAVPRLEKIVLNMGLGEAVRDNRIIEIAVKDLTIIAGQKPIVTKARKSIAGFKLRAGMPIGAKVTLRGTRMWEFLDRLLAIVIPRIRDFRGLNPNAFDGRGNYTMGMNDQMNFPEIEYDEVERQLGMDLTFVTTASGDEGGYALLKALGFPFRERESAAATA